MKGTKDFNTNKGITLIALVITIIVMLILVAVTISMAVNGGLFDYAGKAVSETNKALKAEQQLANGGIEVDGEWYNSIDEYIEHIKGTEKYIPYTLVKEDYNTVCINEDYYEGETLQLMPVTVPAEFEREGVKYKVQTIGSGSMELASEHRVDISEGVTNIERHAFNGFSYADIYIPSTIESIDSEAFLGYGGGANEGIGPIHFDGTKEKWESFNISFYVQNMQVTIICNDGNIVFEC